MAAYVLRRGALPPAEVDALCTALLASPLVGRSTLAGSFRDSRGFALTFTRDAEGQVRARFPALVAFLDLALADPGALRRWRRLWTRVFGPRTPAVETNAFYLNLLVLPAGTGVGRHTDATLRGPAGVPDAVPRRVTVLYLRAPAPSAGGGELRLFRGERRVARIRPVPGTLLHFDGGLQHEVTPVATSGEPAGGDVRVSLVCEQYAFGPEALARLAPLQVMSKAGFGAYLDERSGRTR